MKKFLCSMLAAMFIFSFAPGVLAADYWDEHTGTEEDPYIIDSNADLIALRDRVNAGTEATDKYYMLTQNLTLSSITNWQPIGAEGVVATDKIFKGHFDGNNYAIQVNITDYVYHSGLFGTIETTEGTYAIKNLTVSGKINVHEYSGGIVSRLNSGNIENCSFSGNVEDDSLASISYAGGIVGLMRGGLIKNCSFIGSVKGHSAGGIVGQMEGGSIENCTSNGTINNRTIYYDSYVGGIVGYAQIASFSSIKDCTFSGSVTSITSSVNHKTDYVGGIAGYVTGGNVQNNHVTAVSSANSSITGTYVAGGIAGRIGDSITLESCDVAAGTTVTATTEAAGGIVGLLNDSSTIKNNISYAQILGDTDNKGGIIGKISASTFTSENNKYSNASYGIGYDATGVHSDNPGCIKITPSISITTSSLKEANAGELYSVTLRTNASAETAITWSMANATTLPDGMDINSSTGVISGTPKTAGNYIFTVQATAGTSIATKELTLKINLVIETASTLPDGVVDSSYLQSLSATGASSVTWALKTGSTLPEGLLLAGSAIRGTPQEAVTSKTFTIVATGNGMTAEKVFILSIKAAATDPDPTPYTPTPQEESITITTSNLPSGTVGTSYYTILLSNPSGAIWRITSGSLPSGLYLDSSLGVISGKPTTSSYSRFTVRASKTGYTSAVKTFSINVINLNTQKNNNSGSSGGSGGGCNVGYEIFGLAVLAALILKETKRN